MKFNILLFILMCCLFPPSLFGDWPEEEKKIQYLIREVGSLDGMFIRNGDEHPPEKAVSHLKMKLDNAMNSWFAPKKDEWTAKMFIEKVASESSFSGDPYQIKLKNGTLISAKEWLYKALNQYPDTVLQPK